MADWPPPRDKWFPGFTAHRDGWVRFHKGRTVFCAGRRASRDEVERAWERKRNAIDGADAAPILAPTSKLYREVLSEFLAACEHRVATRQPRPLSKRTLHNYVVALNDFGAFVGGGMPIDQVNRPEVFAAYARRFGAWKASGYDSIVTRVGALFNWAAEMEYIDRYRPGPQFQRPAKSELRDQRIDLSKSFTPAEFANLYHAANTTERCWLGLGLFAAMNNSEIAHLPRACVDLDGAVIDFRRRKTGRIRRVCPLPAFVVDDLRAYQRPEPEHVGDAELFFLSRGGVPYGGTRKRDGKPSDSISRLFRELMRRAGVEHKRGRSFSGLRTTFYNLAPRGEWDQERKLIMGRAHGVDVDSYLEDVGLDRLCHVVTQVEAPISTARADEASRRQQPNAAGADASAPRAGRSGGRARSASRPRA